MLFGRQNFLRTSEFNYCGCCLFHSKKQYVIEGCHFSFIMRLLYLYLKSYLITSLSTGLVEIPYINATHCVLDVSKDDQ